jgi:hypothetical protein
VTYSVNDASALVAARMARYGRDLTDEQRRALESTVPGDIGPCWLVDWGLGMGSGPFLVDKASGEVGTLGAFTTIEDVQWAYQHGIEVGLVDITVVNVAEMEATREFFRNLVWDCTDEFRALTSNLIEEGHDRTAY